MDQALRRIAAARRSHELENDPVKYRVDIATLLNYLESISIGIEHGIYDEELAKKHLGTVLVLHYDQYFGQDGLRVEGIEPANYSPLTKLRNRWSTALA